MNLKKYQNKTRNRVVGSLQIIGITAASLYLSACATHRNVETATTQATLPHLESKLSPAPRFTADEPVILWWKQLEDVTLSELIDRALRSNHDLRMALASVNESRAILRREKLTYIPSLTTSVNATREKRSGDLLGSTQGINEYYQAGFDVSWELDLFGRIGNQVALSNAQLSAREADFKAVQISLAAEVAGAYLRLRGSQQLIDIAERSIALQKQNLRLVEQFLVVGKSSEFDLARAKSQLELTSASLPILQQDYHVAVNRLSVLTIQPTSKLRELLAGGAKLPSIPPSMAIGNPSNLLKRRPDIIQAELALQGAVAEYNLQVADLYPQISLTGNFGFLSTEWSNLGREETQSFWFTPSIRWAALDLTRVKARINAADAKAQRQLARFEKAVLVALNETDNALTRFTKEELRRQRLKVAATESARAARFAQITYQVGRGELRDVLDAEQIRLNTAQQLVQSETTILLNLVDIYRNLGGGWEIVPI